MEEVARERVVAQGLLRLLEALCLSSSSLTLLVPTGL